MFQTRLFTRMLRDDPADASSANARLLERGGFVHKNSAGVYSYLPLGWRVIRNISRIIREEMDAIGGQELLLPALLDRRYLDATGRFDVEVGYEVRGKKSSAVDYILGWTHEEVLTDIAARYVSSYRDLPFSAYQIQTKFRSEARAKSGILRGREFIMKDLYSFHASEEDLADFYGKVRDAYMRVFSRCGLSAVYTEAAGGAFTASVTHEFQVVSPVGEDVIFVCSGCGRAENSEISKLAEGASCPKCQAPVKRETSIEVGNIFPLGTKYSDALNLGFAGKDGARHNVVMGSYGIGVSRLMGTIAEVHHTDQGLAWPVFVAPFPVHILDLARERRRGAELHDFLAQRGIESLCDDRDASAGEKFAGADLLGLPYRAVIGDKTGDKVEFSKRGDSAPRLLSFAECASELSHAA